MDGYYYSESETKNSPYYTNITQHLYTSTSVACLCIEPISNYK
jgi:hypothetical protein